MNDPGFNSLLKWGVENSDASRNDPTVTTKPATQFDPKALHQLFTGEKPQTDAEVMASKMQIIVDPEAPLKAKKDAFEDFEFLVENIDNAINMDHLKLWDPLIKQLEHEEHELRRSAAWCVGTIVENNPRGQERLLILGAIPTLVKLATEDKNQEVRKKAIRAISCASRNFQPGLDVAIESVPAHLKPNGKLDAKDMASVDSLTHTLRDNAQ